MKFDAHMRYDAAMSLEERIQRVLKLPTLGQHLKDGAESAKAEFHSATL